MVPIITAFRAKQNLIRIARDLSVAQDGNALKEWREPFWTLVRSRLREPLNSVPLGVHFGHPVVCDLASIGASASGALEVDDAFLKQSYFGACSLIRAVFPDFSDILDLLGISVHIIPRRPSSAESGSNFIIPGFFFASVSTATKQESVAELIVHELTHNWLFFEEIANGLFLEGVYSRPEATSAASPFKSSRRRFDQSFHALAVAVVTSEFRRRANLPVLTTRVPMKNVIDDLRGIVKKAAASGFPVLTTRGVEMLDQLGTFHSQRTV